MKPIPYIDRVSGKIAYEKVYAGKALEYLYNGSFLSNALKKAISQNYVVSSLVGLWHKQKWTQGKIAPFIKEHEVDSNEFLDPIESFTSFNDFFIRKLKTEARPIASTDAVIPADARYWFYAKQDSSADFLVKGNRLNRKELLGCKESALKFEDGAVIVARLCPSDYHRFHFPIDCIPGEAKLINGPLFSVNPLSIKQNIRHLLENKRKVTFLNSPKFGSVAYIEIGATSVGSIQETYIPNQPALKGQEKGYFEFGGSALILLFQPHTISFSEDLLHATQSGYEIRCLMGQKMGLVNIK